MEPNGSGRVRVPRFGFWIVGSCLLPIIVAVLFFRDCDVVENRYPTFSAASEAGAFARGWLRSFIPQSATNIFDRHDLDVNDQVGCFCFTPRDAPAVVAQLRPLPSHKLPAPPNGCRAECFTRARAGGSAVQIYEAPQDSQSGDLNMVVAVDVERGAAWYWTERERASR